MSLLDIEKTKSELSELDYMLYDNFVKYMEEHVPRPLWDHSNSCPGTMRDVSYIKIESVIPVRITKEENYEYDSIEPMLGGVVSKRHMCIYITPTDDDLVNLEYPEYSSLTFPILTTSDVPKGILNVLEPIKDRLEIIYGIL